MGVNPWDLVKDPAIALWQEPYKRSPSAHGENRSSESTDSASSDEADVPRPVGEDPEVEAEPPFLLEDPSRRSKYVSCIIRLFKVFTREVATPCPRPSRAVSTKKGRVEETRLTMKEMSRIPVPQSSP